MRNYPQDKGLTAYGATTAEATEAVVPASSFRAAFDGLLIGARVPAFWLLAGSFAICGMTTNGLIGTHFIPAANDHGMPTTVAAGLLATIGILDVAGTVFSGWLTDRVDPRILLVVYYTGRGVSLLLLPSLLSPHAEPSTWVFVIFYGLDWVATVPPTIVLCRNYFGAQHPGGVRLGVRIAPDRRGDRRRRRGPAARCAGQLRPRVLPRRGPLPGRCGTLWECPQSAGQHPCGVSFWPTAALASADNCP